MLIIPAIDIINGKCVRLTKGDYGSVKTYNEDPLEVALAFEDHGLSRLHLVDLDGAREKQVVNYKILDKIASRTRLIIDFGGGVQSDDDIQMVFDYGASQVTGGSIAVKKPEIFSEWLKKYGAEKIILGADVIDKKIAVSGWQESSGMHLFDFLENYIEQNIKYVISTDVSKDGMLMGPSIDLYKEISERYESLHLIASGGVSGIDDLVSLSDLGLYGAILGKAIYEGRISLSDLQQLNEQLNPG